jgi:hypothetical protein
VGTFWAPIKIFACSELLWTKVWAGCYTGYCVVTACANFFEEVQSEIEETHTEETRTEETHTERTDTARPDSSWVDWGDVNCGHLAVAIQLIIFAYVDLKPIPPDKDISKRYLYRFYRLLPHILAFFLYIRRLDDRNMRWGKFRRNSAPVLLVIDMVIFVYFLWIDAKYTLLNLAVTLFIPLVVWDLFEVQFFRDFCHLCPEGTGHSKIASCFVFDLFLRLMFFSIYGYIYHYHPEETSKALWLEWLP